jgi:hypothetical protein
MKRGMLFSTWVAVLITAATGCASGPRFNDLQAAIPPLGAEQGRIFFYRPAGMAGAAIQPEIRLNGDVVGRSQPNGFFFVDRYPGSMRVLTETEVENAIEFVLDAGQTRYVETSVSMGFLVGRVTPKLIDPAQGALDVQNLVYTGSQTLFAAPALSTPGAAPVSQKEAGTTPVKLEDLQQLMQKK